MGRRAEPRDKAANITSRSWNFVDGTTGPAKTYTDGEPVGHCPLDGKTIWNGFSNEVSATTTTAPVASYTCDPHRFPRSPDIVVSAERFGLLSLEYCGT